MKTEIYTSESVTIGHPDKICDLIADKILDECLKSDPNSRVACEMMATSKKIIVGGEITTKGKVNYKKIVKDTIKEIGHDLKGVKIDVLVRTQSPDIAGGVGTSFETRELNSKDELDKQGAGDQGIMYGYACDETEQYLPLSFVLSKELTLRLTEVRQKGIINGLLPDGKSQVTVKFLKSGKPKIVNILISTQHKEDFELKDLRKQVKKHVVDYVFKNYDISKTEILINPSGRFVLGGYKADTGVTGRKLQVDSYGTIARQGGGAYSGKDASKVDRSGAYICRYIAKNIVAAGIAKKCEATVAYAIGKANPLAFNLNFFGTETKPEYSEQKIESKIKKLVDLRPKAVINNLKLKQPVFANTVRLGHFGNDIFTWEKLDLSKKLK